MNLKLLVSILILKCCISTVLAQEDCADYDLSTKLTPKFPPEYYLEQGLAYFDTLDSYASHEVRPNYAQNVLRWEWYPWLKLTGYTSEMMKLDSLLTLYPTAVNNRECRYFSVQPFARCRVLFDYKESQKQIKIYEEFTFNDFGEITRSGNLKW